MGFLDNLASGIVNNDYIRNTVKGFGYSNPLTYGVTRTIDALNPTTAINDPNVNLVPGFGVNEAGRVQSATDNRPAGAVPGSFELTPYSPTGQNNSQLPAGGAAGGAGTNQGFLQSLMNTATQGIGQSYQDTLGMLDQNRASLERQLGEAGTAASNIFNQQKSGFDRQLGEANKDLDRSASDIDANKTDALSDLTSDLRAQMESFTRMIGAMGAADSSAAGMGQYAFGRMGQQARGDIWKQANKLMADVGVRREKVKDLYRNNLIELQNWKTNQMQALESDFRAKMDQLEAAKLQADARQREQLNGLQLQIQQEAMSSALQVDQRLASVASANERWAQQQSQTLGNFEKILADTAAKMQVDPIAAGQLETGVNNTFSFGAGDIVRNTPGQQMGAQVALPTARRDDQAV